MNHMVIFHHIWFLPRQIRWLGRSTLTGFGGIGFRQIAQTSSWQVKGEGLWVGWVRGWHPTQFYWDDNKPRIQDPYKLISIMECHNGKFQLHLVSIFDFEERVIMTGPCRKTNFFEGHGFSFPRHPLNPSKAWASGTVWGSQLQSNRCMDAIVAFNTFEWWVNFKQWPILTFEFMFLCCAWFDEVTRSFFHWPLRS